MKFLKLLAIALIINAVWISVVFAATVTWTGGGGDNLASTGLNWDTASAPTTGDAAIYNGAFPVTGSKNSTWDITASLDRVEVTSGYSGVITQTAKLTTSGNNTHGGLKINGGTWTANGQDVQLAHGLRVDGAGTCTINAGSGTWSDTADGGWGATISNANLTFNRETSHFSIRDWVDVGAGDTFYKLTFVTHTGFTITGPVTVTNDLDLKSDNTSNTNFAAGTGAYIYAQGNVKYTSTTKYAYAPGITLEFSGSANQTLTCDSTYFGFDFPVIINKSGGTLTLSGTILFFPDTFTYTAGTVDPGTSHVKFTFTTSVNAGTMHFYDLSFYGQDGSAFTGTLTGALNVDHNFTIDSDHSASSAATFAPGSNTVTIGGNYTKDATYGVFTTGTSTVILTGTSAVDGSTDFYSFTCSGTCTFDDADTFTTHASGTFSGNGSFLSDHASNTADFNVGGTESVVSGVCTRVDNSGTNVGTSGTVTSCIGWTGTAAARRIILIT